MLIHQQQHPHSKLHHTDSILSGVSSNDITHFSSLQSQRGSAQIVFNQLKDNRFVVQRNSITNSASNYKHPSINRNIIINKIEFDYLNRVTRTIDEQDIKNHDEKEKELKEKLNQATNREEDLKSASAIRSSQMGDRNSRRYFTIKTKQKIYGSNELLPGLSNLKKNSSNKAHEMDKKSNENSISQNNQNISKKSGLIDLNLTKASRKKLVHSAPAKIFDRKSSIDSNYSTSSSSSNSETGSELSSDSGVQDDFCRRLSAPKSRPKSCIKFSSQQFDNKYHLIQNSKEYKSIMRDQQQIFSKTMHVDKWVAVHKRPRTSASLSSSHQFDSDQNIGGSLVNHQNTDRKNSSKNIHFLNKHVYSHSGVKKSSNKEINAVGQRQKQFEQLNRKVRSVKELSQLNLIDNIQMRIKREVQDNFKKISRNENQTHFNSVVERVRSFLAQVDEFNDYKNNAPIIKLYEYNVSEI